MALKLGIEKAYDRLDCNSIKKCFVDLGFREKWVNWILQCITATKYNFE